MVVGEFLFLFKKSFKSRRLDLLSNHEICFQNFSFSSRNWRKLQISRFCLQKISFSSRTRKNLYISLVSSQNSRYGFHISLSLLDFTFWHLVNACHPSMKRFTTRETFVFILAIVTMGGLSVKETSSTEKCNPPSPSNTIT